MSAAHKYLDTHEETKWVSGDPRVRKHFQLWGENDEQNRECPCPKRTYIAVEVADTLAGNHVTVCWMLCTESATGAQKGTLIQVQVSWKGEGTGGKQRVSRI